MSTNFEIIDEQIDKHRKNIIIN